MDFMDLLSHRFHGFHDTSYEIYSILATYRVRDFIVVFRNRLHIIHLILESNLTRNLVDFIDFMDLLSHRFHEVHDISHEIYSISATYRVRDFIVVFRNRLHIIHLILEFNLVKNLIDFIDFMTLVSFVDFMV